MRRWRSTSKEKRICSASSNFSMTTSRHHSALIDAIKRSERPMATRSPRFKRTLPFGCSQGVHPRAHPRAQQGYRMRRNKVKIKIQLKRLAKLSLRSLLRSLRSGLLQSKTRATASTKPKAT